MDVVGVRRRQTSVADRAARLAGSVLRNGRHPPAADRVEASLGDWLADRLVDQISDAIDGNVGDIYAAFLQGFRDFFAESAADPLVTAAAALSTLLIASAKL